MCLIYRKEMLIIKNKYIFEEDCIIIELSSKKFGKNYVYIDTEDYDKVKKYNWYANKKENTFYCQACYYENGKKFNIKMHRLLMGFPDCKLIDHKDRNGLNNRKENLRITDHSGNNRNRSAFKNKDRKLPMGVRYNEYTKSFITSWYDDIGDRHFKTFSEKKYGKRKSMWEAIYLRYKMCKKYNYTIDEDLKSKVPYIHVILKRTQNT
jgi:hypothetical protein